MNQVANGYASVGRREEALKFREKTRAWMKIELGANHPNTLTSMADLANSYNETGRHVEAIKLNEET